MKTLIEIVGGDYPVWVDPTTIEALVSRGPDEVLIVLASGQHLTLSDVTFDGVLASLARMNVSDATTDQHTEPQEGPA